MGHYSDPVINDRPGKMKLELLHFKIWPSKKQEFVDRCKQLGRGRSECLRAALQEWMDRNGAPGRKTLDMFDGTYTDSRD